MKPGECYGLDPSRHTDCPDQYGVARHKTRFGNTHGHSIERILVSTPGKHKVNTLCLPVFT